MEHQLIEKTTHTDIGTADFSFNKVIDAFQELPTTSILRSIAAVVPMKMSTGSVINIRRNGVTNSFETVESTMTVNDVSATPLASGLSVEVIHDLFRQYKESAYDYASALLRGIVDKAENDALITFLNTNSLNTTALVLTAPSSAEQTLFELTQRVQELVLKMNTPDFRTYEAFAILPYKYAASISAIQTYIGAKDKDEKRLIVSKIGKTIFYVNPDTTATKVYVGLAVNGSIAASSIIVGDYQQEILRSTFVESFQENIGILNRYATVVNPLSTSGREMLMEFTIS
jgi:hypothetical protein